MGMMYSSASLSGVREKATLLNKRHGVKSDVLTAGGEGECLVFISRCVAAGGRGSLLLRVCGCLEMVSLGVPPAEK